MRLRVAREEYAADGGALGLGADVVALRAALHEQYSAIRAYNAWLGRGVWRPVVLLLHWTTLGASTLEARLDALSRAGTPSAAG